MKTAVISQPMLFPWSGFFELIATADVYIHLDDAQFSPNSFTNRIQVKHAQGWSWMTIPLRKQGLDVAICDLIADSGPWRRKHRNTVQLSLARAPYSRDALQIFDYVYSQSSLLDILTKSIEEPAKYIGVWKAQPVFYSSQLGVPGRGSQRVLDMVRAVGCTRYVTAHGARNYLDHEAFEKAGIVVDYINYSKTPYRQLHGEFLPYVTILDPIASLGADAATLIKPTTTNWRKFAFQPTSVTADHGS